MNPFSWLRRRKDDRHDAAMVTRLSQAIHHGELGEIRRLLREGVRPDSTDGSERLPICIAAEIGNAQALELLLVNISPNALDHGRPPLFFSAARLHIDCIKLLLESGADTNLGTIQHKHLNREFSEIGSTPLHAAMLAYSPPYRTTMDRWIPETHYVSDDILRRKHQCIELLLKAGSNPAIQNDEGVSPLELAHDHQRDLLSKHAEQCQTDCILVNPHRGWPVFIASRLRSAGLKAFGICSETPLVDWKHELLEHCSPRTLILAEGDGIGDLCKRLTGQSMIDLRHDLKPGISAFEQLENTWRLVFRYLDLTGDQSDCLFGLRNRDKTFDIFVSYKSQDVRAARKLTDALLQLGLSVWMAEYEVLLTGQFAFQSSINEGLALSKRAVIFSNSRFSESAYCQMEVLLALQLIPSSNVLEIRMPDERHRFSSLFQERPIRRIDWDNTRPDLSVNAVCELLDLPEFTCAGTASDPVDSSHMELTYRDICVHLQIGKWQAQPSELNLWENISTTAAEFTIPSTDDSLTGRLMIMDAGFGIPAAEDGSLKFQISLDDDRELARITRQCFANHHRFTAQFECRGVHIWCWRGLMMPAFTWFQSPLLLEPGEFRDAAIDTSWDLVRQYSLFVEHPVSGRRLECRFIFKQRGGSDDADERFRRFLEHSDQMEQIVSSTNLSQRQELPSTDLDRPIHVVERAIRRAIALMVLVGRASDEEEYAAADAPLRSKLTERLKSIDAWIENDEIARFLSPRERNHLSEPLGSWPPYVRLVMKRKQAQVPVLLWHAGIEQRPAVATHLLADIYKTIHFGVMDGWQILVDKAMVATAPSGGSLSDFAVVCIMTIARLRNFRQGVKHNPRFIEDFEEHLAMHQWKRPLDATLFRRSSSGDLYLSLFNRPIEQMSDYECIIVEGYSQNQLIACDNLSIPSPGRDFRSQYTADDNLNRILPAFATQYAAAWPEEMWI